MTSTYYYEIPEEIDGMPAGIFCTQYNEQLRNSRPYSKLTLYLHSERVWVQGPKGGVRITKDRGNPRTGYVTKNDKKMKEFMWVKLQATELKRRK